MIIDFYAQISPDSVAAKAIGTIIEMETEGWKTVLTVHSTIFKISEKWGNIVFNSPSGDRKKDTSKSRSFSREWYNL